MQKAISESSTVNLISVGAGADKLVDIEDVLPHSQVVKKNVDSKTEPSKNIKTEEPIEVAVKSEVETEKKLPKVGDTNVESETAGEKISDEKVKKELELKKKSIEISQEEESVDKSDDSKNIEILKEGINELKSEEFDEKDTDNKVDTENQPSAEKDDNNESESHSLEVKAEILAEEDQSKLEVLPDPNSKTNVLGTNPSTSEEIGLPSSSTSRKYFKNINITVTGLINN